MDQVVEPAGKQRWAIPVYFGLLFVVLVSIWLPSLSFPPVSDDWEALYAFHHLDEKPGAIKWLHVLNHDPFEKMRYQPLSHLILYALHLGFGSSYEIGNALNLVLYAANLVLLYRLMRVFGIRRRAAAVGVGVFTFLFSHFDIAIWSSHRYLLAGFGLMTTGFLLFERFLRRRTVPPLVGTGLCLLCGMWCYEAFALWPLALLMRAVLRHRHRTEPQVGSVRSRLRALAPVLATLAVIYAAYVGGYVFTRSLGTYDDPSYAIPEFFDFVRLRNSACLVLFNLLYNGALVNLLPFIAFPLEITENVYMGGPVLESIAQGRPQIVFAGACAVGVLLVGGVLAMRNKPELLKKLAIPLFLALSFQAVVFLARVLTNEFYYGLTEFRYQYVSNAMVVFLVCLLVTDAVGLMTRSRTIALVLLGGLVLGANVTAISKTLAIYTQQLAPLSAMLKSVRKGIGNGAISFRHQLYLPNDVHLYLPSLCWNYEMGERFMHGTYQWLFSKAEQDCFSATPEHAAWTINRRTLELVPATRAALRDRGMPIHIGKAYQYNTIGVLLLEDGKTEEAIINFRKALDGKPDYAAAHFNMARARLNAGDTEGAATHYLAALRLNLTYFAALVEMGALLDGLGRTEEALSYYERALSIDAEHYSALFNYANALRRVGRNEEAVRYYNAALDIDSESPDARNNLGSLLFEMGRLPEAAAEFENALRVESSARTHYNLGLLRLRQEAKRDARDHFGKALNLIEAGDDSVPRERVQRLLDETEQETPVTQEREHDR